MTGLGVLQDRLRLTDQFPPEKVSPARPGSQASPLMATTGSKSSSFSDTLAEAVSTEIQRSYERALRHVETTRTSTTLVALAQCQVALGRHDAAIAAAREALTLSLAPAADGAPSDPASVRIAAETLAQCNDIAFAYNALNNAEHAHSLELTLAVLAAALGKTDEARQAIAAHDDSLAASFRGYLDAVEGRFPQAIHHLRVALSERPDDADSLLNLSISLWNLGSVRKATKTALRATRTAPGRYDISLHYMELLLAQRDFAQLSGEIAHLGAQGVVPGAKFLSLQARMCAELGDESKSAAFFQKAAAAARNEGDLTEEGASLANLTSMRYRLGRLSREQTIAALAKLLTQYPGNDAIAINYAQLSRMASEAAPLRLAMSGLVTTPVRETFLRHHIAFLSGDNDAAGATAQEWFGLEPHNPAAAAAAIIGLGIGQERWEEAAKIAEYVITEFPGNSVILNNAAYVFAMSGRAPEAIRLLEPIANEGFVVQATLGLACLANGDLERGMGLYRDAADKAEREGDEWRSLMTTYQALIVRQLGLDKNTPSLLMKAHALAPVPLPGDWKDRPDFLRLYNVCLRHGYEWPLAL